MLNHVKNKTDHFLSVLRVEEYEGEIIKEAENLEFLKILPELNLDMDSFRSIIMLLLHGCSSDILDEKVIFHNNTKEVWTNICKLLYKINNILKNKGLSHSSQLSIRKTAKHFKLLFKEYDSSFYEVTAWITAALASPRVIIDSYTRNLSAAKMIHYLFLSTGLIGMIFGIDLYFVSDSFSNFISYYKQIVNHYKRLLYSKFYEKKELKIENSEYTTKKFFDILENMKK
tara:strand:- start:465 stop:1151 length:687 start_codon:yes stop_codon:yes gene_type:complete